MLVNLLPYEFRLVNKDTIVFTLPPCENPPSVLEGDRRRAGFEYHEEEKSWYVEEYVIDGYEEGWPTVIGLPPEKEDTKYIVTREMVRLAEDRYDLVAPLDEEPVVDLDSPDKKVIEAEGLVVVSK